MSISVAVALLSMGCAEDAATTSSVTTGGQSSGGSGSGGSGGGGGSGGSGATGGAGAPEWIWGVTIDATEPLPDITAALGKHAKKPTTRIVFDELVPASDYQASATAIHGVSFVMGELLDSFYVSQYAPADYVKRAEEYVSLLGPVVDIWEIGNEINGEWLCGQQASSCSPAQTAEVVAKIEGAFDVVQKAGGKTALTLYLNQDCWSSPDNEMFTWASKNVPNQLRQELDYVFVSYYEDDCNDLQPDWLAVFAQLAALFPNSKLGIGECGTAQVAKKAEWVERYYTLKLPEPRFVGGSFWWYYRQDMVPHSEPLWGVLDGIMAAP